MRLDAKRRVKDISLIAIASQGDKNGITDYIKQLENEYRIYSGIDPKNSDMDRMRKELGKGF